MKRLTLLTLTLVLTALAQLTALSVQAEVSIPDAELAAVIRETLGLPAGAAITADAMRDLTELETAGRGIADLTGLEHAVNLTGLNLGSIFIDGEWRENPMISNLSPLVSLTNLTVLNLRRTAVSDVSPLASLTNLEELNLWGTAVSDVSPLANLTNLTGLDLVDTDVSDISPLASLTNLVELDLRGIDVSDISLLANLTNLTELGFSGDVSDVSPLANLTNLKTLELGYTDVSDISPLANLTNLKTLELGYTDVSDISPLANLTNLEVLWLARTAVSDISPLASLTNLTRLHLGGTAVSDISPLASLTNLTQLYLGGTAVSDISPLASLTNLTQLWFWDDTAVSDVSPLANLTNLTGLSLWGTAVSDVSPLTGLTNLVMLELGGCQLSYVSIHTHIPALQAEGIDVRFPNVAHPALFKVSGDRQEGASGATLETAFVVEAMDEHGRPIVGRTVEFDILGGGGRLSAKTVATDAQGNARVTLTLGSSQGVNKVRASSEGIRSWALFTAVGTEAAPQLVADVNGDGVVNIQDLVLVSGQFGKTGEHVADVNGDGVVNIQDLVLVAGAFGEGAAAPSVHAISLSRLTASDVEGWLIEAQESMRSGSGNAPRPGGLSYLRGIAVLEQLLTSLMPKETALFANYPNPFNPETWIPYQLSEPAEVTVTIYAANGAVVRTLDLGHRRAGSYDSRSRAAYWDGQNEQGEPVASGVYFYTLKAGEFSATRKMVIRK